MARRTLRAKVAWLISHGHGFTIRGARGRSRLWDISVPQAQGVFARGWAGRRKIRGWVNMLFGRALCPWRFPE